MAGRRQGGLCGSGVSGAKERREIAQTTSLASYWKKLTGTDVNNHALACSVAFDTFVKGGLIDEADYDKVSAQALETASAISNEVGGELTHEALAKAAHELKDRSKNMQKELQKILDGLKGRKKLTPKQVQDFMQRAFEDNQHLVVTAMCLAEMAHVKDADIAEGFFTTMHSAVSAIELNTDENGARRFTDETVDAWMNKPQHSTPKFTGNDAGDDEEETTNQPTSKAA